MELTRRLGAEVHHQVGAPERQAPEAAAGARDVHGGVIPLGGIQHRDDLQRAGS
jgi:hypothetical protein